MKIINNILFLLLLTFLNLYSVAQICPTGGTQRPPSLVPWPPSHPTGSSEAIASNDPNAIIGPDGQPAKHWVSVKDRLPYTITFENDKSASAPAKYIKVITPIEPKQEAATFQLGSFGFNNLVFSIPPNTPSYYNRLDVRDSLGLYVDVTAGYDVSKNEAFWEFQSIDPITLLPPTNPLIGLLLLQDSTKPTSGHGFVNFSIKPKVTAITLDTIVAKASIVFDSNDTIPTNLHKNTIDAFAPITHMSSLPMIANNPLTLSWTGNDDANGSGIKFYTLYVSTDGINYSILGNNIRRNDTTISLANDSTYCFFVLASDSVGNIENLRNSEIKCTKIGPAISLPLTGLVFTGNNIGKDNFLNWSTLSEYNTDKFILERSFNGSVFNAIASKQAAGNSSSQKQYSYTDANINRWNSTIFYYRVKQLDFNNAATFSNTILLRYNTAKDSKSIVYPNPTINNINISIGDNKLLGTMANLYDANGRQISSTKINSTVQSIDLSKLANGIYFIKLQNKENFSIIKQ